MSEKQKPRKRRYLTTKNLFAQKDVEPIKLANDKFNELIGNMEPYGSWFIAGHEGNGKTTLALELAKAISFYQKVLYVSAEQGKDPSFVAAARRVGIVDNDPVLWEYEAIPLMQLKENLKLRNAPKVVIIDNLTMYEGEFSKKDYKNMITELPHTLFIFISHKNGNKPTPAIASHIFKLSKVKIDIVGLMANFKSRMAPPGEYVLSDSAEIFHSSKIFEQQP